jgi:hypothetical protein
MPYEIGEICGFVVEFGCGTIGDGELPDFFGCLFHGILVLIIKWVGLLLELALKNN